eukprot:9478309-Pyramimonas_sp.AAC.1
MSDSGQYTPFGVLIGQTPGYDKAICMYDSERPKEMCWKFENCHAGAICSLAFDADNNWIITGSYDGTVKIWSQEVRPPAPPLPYWIVTGSYDGT